MTASKATTRRAALPWRWIGRRRHFRSRALPGELIKENDAVESIREIASLVRSVAEEVSVDIRNRCYADRFPNGWCQVTSRVMGKLLHNLGEDGFKLVFGKRELVIDAETGRGSEPTHVWLDRDGVIVDITADQFSEEISDPVLVTTDRSWHDTWLDQQEYDLDDVSGQLECALYEAIVDHPAWHIRYLSLPNHSTALK